MKSADRNVAERYAKAVLQLAQSAGGDLDEKVLADISAVNKVIGETSDLSTVLAHPGITGVEKKKMIVEMFKKHVQESTLRLLELLIDKRRFELLPLIESEYRNLLFASKNIVTATLTSAEQLDDATVAGIKKKIGDKLGKKLELDVQVDKALMGGAVLRVGDQVIDGSLLGKLQSLEKVLVSV